MTTTGYISRAEVERLGRAMPHGIVRFTDSGKLADWREDILGWMVTGSERAWGDPLELVRTFGPYEAVAVVSPTPPTEPTDAEESAWRAFADPYFESGRALPLAGAVFRAGFVAGNQEQEK